MADKDKDQTPTPTPVATKPTTKVRALMPFENPLTKQVVLPGQTAEVPADFAVELQRDLGGQYAFRGERYSADGDVKRHACKRAELVAA